MIDIPLIRPSPPRLSQMQSELLEIEASGVYSNNGPTVQRLEREMTEKLFGGIGGVVTTANATTALIIAIKHATAGFDARRNLALMPSFTFAATGHAALWAGLTPLLCDIEPENWTASAAAEERLLKQYGDRIATIVPYATFGTVIDLERYAYLSGKYDVGVVVDAASSLGTTMPNGHNFGTGSRLGIIYSMHATKTFACGEGGVIYSADRDKLASYRTMASFGFGQARAATMPGLNAKLSEIGGLLALGKLAEINKVVAHRSILASVYRSELLEFGGQAPFLGVQALQFMPVLLPAWLSLDRATVMAQLAANGIGSAAYFSPHMADQPYFAQNCLRGDLSVTETVASRVLCLPLFDTMSVSEVLRVTAALRDACALSESSHQQPQMIRSSVAHDLHVSAPHVRMPY